MNLTTLLLAFVVTFGPLGAMVEGMRVWVARSENPWWTRGAFLWGAFPASLAAFGVVRLAGVSLEGFLPVAATQGVLAVLVAPVVEEPLKAAAPAAVALMARLGEARRALILLAALASAAGFAMAENYLALLNAAAPAEPAIFWSTAALRLAGTASMHIAAGLLPALAGMRFGWPAAVVGLLGAVVLHALWNAGALVALHTGQPWLLLPQTLLAVGMLLTMLGMVIKRSKKPF